MKQMVCWLTAGLLTLGGLPARAGDTVPAVPETPAAPAAPVVQETPASSAAPGFWQRSWNNVETTWRSDRYELYIPAVTWHNRAFYDRDKIDEYNEQPWGLGLGRYRYDSDGNWHALYAMFFLDSHDKVEPFAGYAWQKIWRPADDLRLGAGFTVGVWPCRPRTFPVVTTTATCCSAGCAGSCNPQTRNRPPLRQQTDSLEHCT